MLLSFPLSDINAAPNFSEQRLQKCDKSLSSNRLEVFLVILSELRKLGSGRNGV